MQGAACRRQEYATTTYWCNSNGPTSNTNLCHNQWWVFLVPWCLSICKVTFSSVLTLQALPVSTRQLSRCTFEPPLSEYRTGRRGKQIRRPAALKIPPPSSLKWITDHVTIVQFNYYALQSNFLSKLRVFRFPTMSIFHQIYLLSHWRVLSAMVVLSLWSHSRRIIRRSSDTLAQFFVFSSNNESRAYYDVIW